MDTTTKTKTKTAKPAKPAAKPAAAAMVTLSYNRSVKFIFGAALIFSLYSVILLTEIVHTTSPLNGYVVSSESESEVEVNAVPIPKRGNTPKTRKMYAALKRYQNQKQKQKQNQNHQTQVVVHGSSSKTVDNADADADGIDWSDLIFRRQGWDNDPVVIESHKLLFFTVPKNACTTFKKLFRRMMNHTNWKQASPHNPKTNGLKYLGNYPKEEQRIMMTSRDWTRAIFVRDPLERALSAYMEKGLTPAPSAAAAATGTKLTSVEGSHIKRSCCGLTGGGGNATTNIPICHESPMVPYENPLTEANFPFETFVVRILRTCWDTHWSPQHTRLTKISNWKHINFVGRFEHKMADTHRLLKRIGAFEEYGASGWDDAKAIPNDNDKNTTTTTKSLSIFETNTALHKTGSGNRMDKFYANEKVRKLVYRYYRKDYDLKLFNFTIPILPK